MASPLIRDLLRGSLIRIGAVLFDRRLRSPRRFTSTISNEVKRNWIERSTQIVPIEIIVALETFVDRVKGADAFLSIDSEAVEGALIKGYSSREDLCLLVSIF